MTKAAPAVVSLADLARGLIAGLPHTGQVLRGVGALLKARFATAYSIGAVLEARASAQPDAPALLFEDRRWTYAEFNAWANRLAHTFRKAGVTEGTVVGLLMENHASGLACVAALVKLGAIAGMLNPNLRGDALRHSLRAIQPRFLVVAGECVEAFGGVAADWNGAAPFWLAGHGTAPCPPAWRDLEALSAHAPAGNPASTGSVAIDRPCYYILTSGTTGMPKASVMTHRRWLRGMAGFGPLLLHLQRGEALYCALPLYHNNALTVSWGAALGCGAALALDRKFSASRFWDRIRHYDAVAFAYIGELCRYLLAQPPSARDREHRVRACVGNGLRPEIWQPFKQRFGIAQVSEFYGASEGNLAFVNAFNVDETAGFCPFSHAVVECDTDTAEPKRDAKGRLVEVSRGGVGLLITEVTDTAPFDGYTDARAGQSRLLRDAFKKGDCWVNTGDLVRDQGWHHIQFVDRLGDTFRWKGENVATTEVEAALRGAPGVADCTVYGVKVPGADGRAGMAAVRLEDGAAFDGAALAAHLRAALPAYAVPAFVRLVASLATTATFKTMKHGLRDEGCDPRRVGDPLYVLVPDSAAYAPFSHEHWAALERGALRL